MPLNTLRLNHAPSSHPNDRIVFIKPLPRPPSDKKSYHTADTFLRAIAAQCLPIMKKHHLAVTTLAEHEPNREFIGRNFNNGEIIELVLRTPSGGWVSFQMVQMVMMHELAHNMHMNHGKGFWETRNLFSKEIKDLWAKRYTGEGFWGGGRVLGDLSSVMGNNIVPSEELQDIKVCGGTFRSRRTKRKAAGTELTWKEKRNRRIEKKFGKNGQSLGEDEDQRLRLQIGSKGPIGAKPRVAGSKRGRELRAAAALARFGPNKKEVDELNPERLEEDSSEDDEDGHEEVEEPGEDALDSTGHRMLDKDGKNLIRVCGEEDGARDEAQVRNEMDELEDLDSDFITYQNNGALTSEDEEELPATKSVPSKRTKPMNGNPRRSPPSQSERPAKPALPEMATTTTTNASSNTIDCPICSMSNDRLNPTCCACANVLDKEKMPSYWVCNSEACKDTEYVNSGNCGRCGVCAMIKA